MISKFTFSIDLCKLLLKVKVLFTATPNFKIFKIINLIYHSTYLSIHLSINISLYFSTLFYQSI